jgi:hypothetical protein
MAQRNSKPGKNKKTTRRPAPTPASHGADPLRNLHGAGIAEGPEGGTAATGRRGESGPGSSLAGSATGDEDDLAGIDATGEPAATARPRRNSRLAPAALRRSGREA